MAIMAMKLGAKRVTAFDIDEWSVENGKENFEINSFDSLEMQTGNISSVRTEEAYHLILANINKNVLLLLSGFYESDITDISEKAKNYGLSLVGKKVRNKWTSVLFKKEGVKS